VQARYRKSEKGKAAAFRGNVRSNAKEPFKRKANNKVKHAVARGHIPRPADLCCSEASDACSGRHEYHHSSYMEEDWLNVTVLCRHHHIEWHKHNKARTA